LENNYHYMKLYFKINHLDDTYTIYSILEWNWWCFLLKVYTAILFQLIVWSGFSVIEWLSHHDLIFYKVLMFGVFFYLALIIGNYIIRSPRKTLLATIISLSIYGSFHLIMSIVSVV